MNPLALLGAYRWLVYAGIALAAVLAIRWEYSRVDQAGYNRADAAWRLQIATDAAAAQKTARLREQAARQREGELVKISNQVQVQYAKVKQQAASDAVAAGDELAALRSVLDDRAQDDAGRLGAGGAACPDPAASARIDGARTERQLLGQCAAVAVGLAQEADRLEGKLSALQQWVSGVLGAK